MMKSTLILSLVFMFSLLPHFQDELEDDDTVANFKAAFLFQFATSNNWQNSGDGSEFTIGVLGGKSVHDELVDKFSSKPIGGQSLVIASVESTADLDGIQLLYISKAFSKNSGAVETQKWIQELKDESVLVVTDHPQGIEWGGAINFK
ncbi:MAG: YfiR family protein, partial [Flavobacteriales bacterium]